MRLGVKRHMHLQPSRMRSEGRGGGVRIDLTKCMTGPESSTSAALSCQLHIRAFKQCFKRDSLKLFKYNGGVPVHLTEEQPSFFTNSF